MIASLICTKVGLLVAVSVTGGWVGSTMIEYVVLDWFNVGFVVGIEPTIA